MKSRCKTGFTLVELLVVIAIIGIIIAITLPALGSTVRRSRELQCLANIREANTIATAWSLENRDLPPHFETNPYLSDPLGVPQINIPYPGFTATQNYFDQTFLWIRVIRPASEPIPRWLTCTGLGWQESTPLGTNNYASTTYEISSALLAAPSVFTPETMAEYEPSMFTPQSLTKVAFPSAKSFLSEQTVFHLNGDGLPTEELRLPPAPVSFVDGHAEVRSFAEANHSPIPADATSSQAFMHTVRGVLGSDV